MIRKCSVCLLVVALVLFVAGCSSATRPAAGTYVSQNNPNAYIELRRDGSCYADLYGMGMAERGNWKLNGDTVTMEFSQGTVLRAKLQGGTLVFPKDSLVGFGCGTHWRKR